MRSEIDLTPFGFTATESHVYAVLLQLGPSTGYGVAHAARVARANTYGALEGLVRRTAAARLPGRPARFRATDPTALIAQLAAQQGESLDRLSRSLLNATAPAEPETRTVTGARAVAHLIMQLVARARRRARERGPLGRRVAGEPPAEVAALVTGSAPVDTPTVLVIDDRQVVVTAGSGEAAAGLWSSDPAIDRKSVVEGKR